MIWWYFLLSPFAILYDFITRCRNWFFDIGILKIHRFPDLKIISVGNLSVGGTGKTPMVEYLIRWMIMRNQKIAVLSRGYGRKTKGVRVAESFDSPRTLGDEPFVYYKYFGKKIKVVVAERRVEGIRKIKLAFPEIRIILLDDSFQHRSLGVDFSILLTTVAKPFWKDFPMPVGKLREARKGWRRADFLILTKADSDTSVPNKFNIPNAVTCVNYESPRMMSGILKDQIFAIAGLADNQPFFDHIRMAYSLTDVRGFSDHHNYSEKDIQLFLDKSSDVSILTTSKDAVKLSSFNQMKKVSWGYIPISVKFAKGEELLEQELENFIYE